MKYRVSSCRDVLGRTWWRVESKRLLLSRWKYVSHTLQKEKEEADALKKILEMSGTQFDIFKPTLKIKELLNYKDQAP